MSLQVWLPLNGNTNNQGVASVTVTNNGATSNDNGKIGKCYYFNGSSWIKISLPTGMTSIKNTTVAMWVKGDTAFGGISHDGDTISGACIIFYDKYWQVVGDGTYLASGKGKYDTVNADSWHHVACAISDTGLSMYFDGALVSTASISANKIKTDLPSGAFIEIGADHPGGDEFLTGYVNDFRVYDHCLSTREVKELSKGLVLHYPLNQPERSQNLIANSTTVIGGGNAAGITSELMSDGSLKIVATSGNNNYRSCRFADSTITDNNIEKHLAAGANYTVSLDIKVEDGTAFPTLFLNSNYHPLLGGDPNKHGIWQRVYQTGSYVGRTDNYGYMSLHLGFSGAIGTYYVRNFKLEVGANTNPKWSPAVTDVGNWGLTEYDTSGYKNNGSVPSATPPIIGDDSPRYDNCYSFNGTNQYIDAGKGAKVKDAITVAWWGYMDSWSSYGRAISCTEGGGWNFEPTDGKMMLTVGTGASTNAYQHVSSKTNLTDLSAGWHHWVGTYDGLKLCLYKDGVLDNSVTPYTTKTPIFYPANQIFIGCEANGSSPGSPYFKGKISDVRIYATALSAEDVKELYNVPFSVTDMGRLLVQGEVSEP